MLFRSTSRSSTTVNATKSDSPTAPPQRPTLPAEQPDLSEQRVHGTLATPEASCLPQGLATTNNSEHEHRSPQVDHPTGSRRGGVRERRTEPGVDRSETQYEPASGQPAAFVPRRHRAADLQARTATHLIAGCELTPVSSGDRRHKSGGPCLPGQSINGSYLKRRAGARATARTAAA